MPSTQQSLMVLAGEMRKNSERWFPQIHDGSIDLTTFYALGLAGEAGEVANIAKKLMRSEPGLNVVDLHAGLATELADVFTYLLLLAEELGVLLVDEYERKVAVNEERWG